MATTSQTPAGSTVADLNDIGVNDLGPLAWVLDELRKSLDSATKAIRRYVRDAELAKGSDLNAADASQLRIARQQLHQSVGALEMVGFASPATILRGMEGAVQKFVAKPELCTETAAAKVERASFALLGYLEALLIGKKPSAVELFSQYADVQELAGASRVHPADLWAVPWKWRDVQDTGAAALAMDANFRARFDKSALLVVKTADLQACAELAQLSAGLANQTELAVDTNFRVFWRLAAGMFQAVATESLKADLHVKRTASRLLIQLSTHYKGDLSVPDRLAQDLLFFCAQASPQGSTPYLGEVRMVYSLASHIPVDYSQSFYGQFDPSLLVQARKRISQLKESWSALTAGELSKSKPVQDQMSLLVDSIGKLLPNSGQSLIAAFNEVIDSTARIQKPPEAALGMEVATAILYLEASFEDFDPEDKLQAGRIAHLAQRVQMSRGGAPSQPLESWMEDLYRRVSDRQTMGSVVGELKLTLSELEKMLDAYFRDPLDKVLLSDVPSRIAQMRGVLTVLGLDQATMAVTHMRSSVERILLADVEKERESLLPAFNTLGNNLGALGFLIDMLSYQPVLAKKMFVFDEAQGELKPLMGRTLAKESEDIQREEASIAGSSVVPAATTSAGISAESMVPTAVAAPTVVAAPVIVDADEVDPELLDIFLEEAREVVGNGLAATQALVAEPNNIGEMTTLRRAFHTLKGSSRMVGLNVFGEAAWSMEQVLNAWLADQKPASQELCELSTQSLNAHQIWIEEIASGGGKQRSAAPFRSSADALRLQGQFKPIEFDAPAATLQASTAAIASITLADPSAANTVSLDTPLALPELNLPDLTLDAFAKPAIEPSNDTVVGVSTPQQISNTEPDFSSHLSDLDSGLAPASSPMLLEPEPVITIATPVASPFTPASAAPIAASDAAFDLDFDFDAAKTHTQPETLPEPSLNDFVASQSSSNILTSDVGSNTIQVPELQTAALDAAPAMDSVKPEEPQISAQEQDALITAEELAAFEQAMMAMDDAPASSNGVLLQAPAAPAPEIATGLTQTNDFTVDSIDEIDLAALQSLHPAPNAKPADAAFDATALATTLQQMPASQSLKDELDRPSFENQATVPATLESLTSASSKSDLGIDLNGPEDARTPSPSSFMSVSGTNPYGAEEQFKAIGPLRVSLPLYNVYLNEADEWSRRLVNSLTEWSMEPQAKMPSDAAAFAHSLAGSSATVGFSALSGLARHLENTLAHMQRIEEDNEYDAHAHASLFVSAAEEIRHLLHQFAAGFLKDSSPTIEAELARCMQAPFTPDASGFEENVITAETASGFVFLESDEPIVAGETAAALADKQTVGNVEAMSAAPISVERPWSDSGIVLPSSDFSPTVPQANNPSETSKAEASSSTALAGAAAFSALGTTATLAASKKEDAKLEVSVSQEPTPASAETTAPLASLSTAPVLAVRSRQVGQDEIDDEIDVQDALDPDLFEIFEEEAQEIFPATASALRQWSARPENMSARSEVLRGLHTLKGSARLAGAMRLGEMAHRMESNVETIPQEGAQSADIEALMAQLDGMQHNFDVLRNPALAAAESTQSVKAAHAAAPAASTSITASANANSTATLASVSTLKPVAAAAGIVTPASLRSAPGQTVRVRAQLLDRLMNQAGEVMITRARLEAELSQLRGSLSDLGGNLEKLRSQLRELDVQAESQMQTRLQQSKETEAAFDPLEFDRYTRVQELTRMMAESVNDVATVQRNIQRTIESTEDDLVNQARQTRELQRDLLRTRMVEFEGISERLYRVVRQAGKDAGKQVKLDILGGTIEMDRGVLDRMTPAFEHLLRNCVAHGIETAEARTAAGKAASGEIVITLHQEGNDVSIEFRDDGAGLNIARIREKAISQGLLGHDAALADNEAANLIFTPGFSTAATVTELSGRGVGMDVVRSEVVALGGRIETATSAGQGTSFKLVLPLTTAVTQVVMLRIGQLAIGVPANLIETVRRATQKELQSAYNSGTYEFAGESLPFYWAGALLQHSAASNEPATKTLPIAVFRSAAQRVVMHVDEVLGNQEVVVKNLGPQLSRLPGLAGMTVMTSGAVALIYNPVALATVYGAQARAMSFDPAQPHALESQSQMGSLQDVVDAVPRELTGDAQPVVPLVPANPASISPPTVPMVLVVDDSITVRRVTQRLLQREGYRVSMAADGLQALERLAEELPSVILSDIEMPRMDGFDLLRNVRADEKLKHLPTIMITSRIAEKHREYAFELGANHYLGKPYNEEELLSLIRRYAREEATV